MKTKQNKKSDIVKLQLVSKYFLYSLFVPYFLHTLPLSCPTKPQTTRGILTIK